MALSDILQKINDEAGKQAAFMKQVADDEIVKIKEEAITRAEARRAEIAAKAQEKAERLKEKAQLLAKMEARNQLLSEKREVIEMVYEEAVKELKHLKGHDLESLYKLMFQATSKTMPKAYVAVAEGHKREVMEAIEKTGVDYHVKEEDAAVKGGVILSNGKQEMNLSFPYFINEIVRPGTELEVAKILFE